MIQPDELHDLSDVDKVNDLREFVQEWADSRNYRWKEMDHLVNTPIFELVKNIIEYQKSCPPSPKLLPLDEHEEFHKKLEDIKAKRFFLPDPEWPEEYTGVDADCEEGRIWNEAVRACRAAWEKSKNVETTNNFN